MSRKLENQNNQAFIDGQNLRLGTTLGNDYTDAWKVDLKRFRVYLEQKYGVSMAYYFVGAYQVENDKMYNAIRRYGYEVIFREHSNDFASNKKGNVDTDIVFTVMKKLVEREKLTSVVLVSGDGDYWRMVDYLISKDKFKKLLAPGRHHTSSLYRRRMSDTFIDYLDSPAVKKKIALRGWVPRDR